MPISRHHVSSFVYNKGFLCGWNLDDNDKRERY
jgi:hypothetical protein